MIPITINRNPNRGNPFGIFDKIYCINLDRRNDRWIESESEFNKHQIKVERVRAVDGLSDEVGNSNSITKSEMGCLLSHSMIIKLIIKEGYKRVLILEDDICFDDNLCNLFSSYIGQVPLDWDMLYLGGTHIQKPIKVSDNVGKLKQTFTTSHYALTNQMAKNVIQEIEKYKAPIDVVYSKFHPVTKCYSFIPRLAWQRDSKSDIQK